MSTHQQVGKTVADNPTISTVVGKLENACQLESQSDQSITDLSANWQIGSPANLPASENPHEHRVPGDFQVGEISPSYYVGEGPNGPSDLRGGDVGRSLKVEDSEPLSTILALDLGTHTGWAIRQSDGSLSSGTAHFSPQRFEGGGMRFLRFKRWLHELQTSCSRIDAVFFEEVRRHAGVDAAHAYGGFMSHLTAWCEQHGTPDQGVPVGTIKKHATGKGNANKDEMVSAARRRGYTPGDDNEADALALLHWVIETQEA